MDKRLKYAGGEIEISSDEINRMPESNQGAIFGINKGLTATGQDMIASGVFAIINAGVDAVVQEGFVVLDGETLKVDAQTVLRTEGTDIYQFQKVTTYPSDGVRNFRDNTSHNVYEKNRAVVVNVAAITTLSVIGDTLIDKLKELIRIQSDWNQANAAEPDYIKNKPNVLNVLLQGKVDGIEVGSGGAVGAVSGGITSVTLLNAEPSELRIRIAFASIGTTDYHPLLTLESKSADWDLDNDVFCMVKTKTATTLEILFREDAGNVQDLTLLVSIIPF